MLAGRSDVTESAVVRLDIVNRQVGESWGRTSQPVSVSILLQSVMFLTMDERRG
jgi:hypothetical protein